jgi:light-regulated signal transduction histidine kinase (bacteriophytochrome)
MQEPVRMMNSYAGMLVDDNTEILNERSRKYLRYIISNAGRMQKMIQDILTFSRVGREEVQIEAISCSDIVREVLVEFEPIIKEKNALVIHDDLPTLDSGRTLLLVLFQNLIGNALKFQNGAKAPEVEIYAEPRESLWRIFVRDNGIGIDPSFRNKIFAIFQRLHRKEDYPGTGIGLSTCKKFVELFGGDIGFESMPGHGSTFYFTLPQKSNMR